MFKKKAEENNSINIVLPTSWQELSDEQIRTIFKFIAMNLSDAEVKFLCMAKWNKIEVLGKTERKGEYWVKVGKKTFALNARTANNLTAPLDFINEIPTFPIRISQIGKHKAIPPDFEGVPFEKFLYCDNLFQGYLHTQSNELLKEMLQIIYDIRDDKKMKDIDAYAVMTFYWFAALKTLFAKYFPNFYMPIAEVQEPDMLQGQSLHQKLTAAVNAQIRALTGGDVTKEPYVMKMDTLRALTELDAKAREAEEIRKQTAK